MRKIKRDSVQKLLDGMCHLTGHKLYPHDGVCERCRRPIIYYSVSINNNYIKTEANIFETSTVVFDLPVCRGDLIEVTALARNGRKYKRFSKKFKVRKPRRTFSFQLR